MGTQMRTPAQASTALTRQELSYRHLLRTLPKGYVSPPRKRRGTPNIEDAPLSSSDEDSSSVQDVNTNNNAYDSPPSGWRQPREYVNTGKETLHAGVAGRASTEFRQPPSKTNVTAQRRSTRAQGATSSPKRSSGVMEPSDNDNILDEFGQMRSSQGQSRAKKIRVYGPGAVNIHGSGSAGRAQYTTKGSNATARSKSGDTDGFRIPDLEAMEGKCKYRRRTLFSSVGLTPFSE